MHKNIWFEKSWNVFEKSTLSRLAFKSASRAYCPYLYCFIGAAGGKLGAVVVPCDGLDGV
jgi:hypothetical protein